MNSPECASVKMNFSFSYGDSAAHTRAIVICADAMLGQDDDECTVMQRL